MAASDSFYDFKDQLGKLYSKAAYKEDGVESLCLQGGNDLELLSQISEILSFAKSLSVETSFRLEIDEDYTEIDDLEPYLNGKYGFSEWRLILNKFALSKGLKTNDSDTAIFIFYDKNVFSKWLGSLDPLKSSNNIFVQHHSVMIFVADLKESFGGPRLAVRPLDSKDSVSEWWPFADILPSEETLKEHVHLVPSEPMSISPRSFALTWGDFGCETANSFRKMCAMCVAAGLADVIYSRDRVVVKGVRHLEIALCEDAENAPDKEALTLLQSALAWVYEERVDTRKRLLSDRLCLDSDNENSFLSLLVQHLDNALKQSKDQYRFVILDRKDEYTKELRSLLKDLRLQADLYAEKVRGLISGLLRDTLAAFVFVALSLSSRLGSKLDVLMSDAGILFFKALAVYFVVSAVLQASSSCKDLLLSDKELARWAEVTREYFTKIELDARIKGDLRGRRNTFYIYLLLIVASYLSMAYFSWNMQYVVNCLLDIAPEIK